MSNQIHETVYRLEYTNKYAVHPIYVPVYVHYTKTKSALSIVKVIPCIPSQSDIVKDIDIKKLELDLNNDFKIGMLL